MLFLSLLAFTPGQTNSMLRSTCELMDKSNVFFIGLCIKDHKIDGKNWSAFRIELNLDLVNSATILLCELAGTKLTYEIRFSVCGYI